MQYLSRMDSGSSGSKEDEEASRRNGVSYQQLVAEPQTSCSRLHWTGQPAAAVLTATAANGRVIAEWKPHMEMATP